jgi:site-specific recombinase
MLKTKEVIMGIHSFFSKWRQSSRDRTGLDVLLGMAPSQPSASLRERLNWLRQLIRWVNSDAGQLQVARLRYILQILDKNPDLKLKVSATLRSIVKDTRALELFMHVGIPSEQGFLAECIERVYLRFLPQPPRDHDLISVFSSTFRFKEDARWIRQMDTELLQGWLDLFQFSAESSDWNSLLQDVRDAVFLLAREISSLGISRVIRNRVAVADFRKLPFLDLSEAVSKLLSAEDEEARKEAYRNVRRTMDLCTATLAEVYRHFRTRGVSIALVYQVERLKFLLRRLDTLSRLLAGYENDPRFIREFFALLVEENVRARGIRGLINDNVVLVCHKIVETNAETGEHYISRDLSEHYKIIKSAAGGGVITGFTTLFKMLLHLLTIPPFIWGLLASINYAVSFVAIQMMGFTLATKQPAMTATVLASKIESNGDDVKPLIEEIIHLLRSQIATVTGNLISVIPMVVLIDLAFVYFGKHFVGSEYAVKTIDSFSLLGPTPIYAAWTGVLLWASSVFSGLFANWFSFRGLPEAFEHHPRLIYVFGKKRTQTFSRFLSRNMGGFAANISLGFLLGMSLPLSSFFGVPLDVRHVTLSTGQMAAAASALGAQFFWMPSFWWGVGGLVSMGVLNLAVSFSLALVVAIWAKRTTAPSRSAVFKALFIRVVRAPWVLFLPAQKASV